MSEPTFLTGQYDPAYLDPRLFTSHFSDQAMEELWGPEIQHILYHMTWVNEPRHNGWLRGVAPWPQFFNQSDTMYLPRFARIIEQHLGQHPRAGGRNVHVMPLFERYGKATGYRAAGLYMTEIPVVRTGEMASLGAVSTIGTDIYDRLKEIAEKCLPFVINQGSLQYEWTGAWEGTLPLDRVDGSYGEIPSFHVAVIGSIIEGMLRERADLTREHVCCIGWDARDMVLPEAYRGFADSPWVSYRIHPIPTIVS